MRQSATRPDRSFARFSSAAVQSCAFSPRQLALLPLPDVVLAAIHPDPLSDPVPSFDRPALHHPSTAPSPCPSHQATPTSAPTTLMTTATTTAPQPARLVGPPKRQPSSSTTPSRSTGPRELASVVSHIYVGLESAQIV